MRKILVTLGGILISLLALAFLLPFFIDLNNYKAEISAKVRDFTGRDLKIEGPIQLRILPTPSVSLQKISLSNLPGASRDNMAEIEKLSVRVEILSLFRKKIHVTRVDIINPHLYLEKLAAGPNWILKPLPREGQISEPGKAPQGEKGTAFQFKFRDVQVSGGYIEYKEGKETPRKVENLDMTLKASSLDGPVEAEGNATLLGQMLNFDLFLAGLKGEQALKGSFEMAETQLRLEGKANPEALTYSGTIKGEGNLQKLFDAFGAGISLPASLGGKAMLEGEVSCTENKISLRPLAVTLQGVKAEGRLAITLMPTLKIDGEFSGLPGGTATSFALVRREKTTEGPFTLSTQNPKALLVWLQLPTDQISPKALKPVHFEGKLDLPGEKLQISDMSLKVGDSSLAGGFGIPFGKGAKISVDLKTPDIGAFLPLITSSLPSVKGSAYLKGHFAGNLTELVFEDASLGLRSVHLKAGGKVAHLLTRPQIKGTFSLSGDSLSDALKMAGIVTEGSYGPYKAEGTLDGDFKNLMNVEAKGRFEALQIFLKGTLSDLASRLGIQLDLALSHPDLKAFLGNFGFSDAVDKGSVQLSATLSGQAKNYKLTDLKGAFGSSFSLSGGGDVNLSAVRPKVQAHLRLSDVNLDALWAMAETYGNLWQNREPRLILVAKRDPKNPSSESPAHGRWSQTPLKLDFLKRFDGNISLEAPSIKRKDIVIHQAQARARINNGILEIPHLTGTIFGGKLQSFLRLESGRNDLTVDVNLQEANLKNLLTRGANVKIVEGILTLSAHFKTHGISMAQLMSQLDGQISLEAKDGVIHGFDLQALSRQVSALKDIGGFAGLFMTYMAGGSTPFKAYNAVVQFQKGVGKIDRMTLSAKGGEGSASGVIDLPKYHLDIWGQFRLTEHPKFPPFKMHLYGPIDHPQRGFDISSLQKYLLDNVLRDVVSKVLGGKREKGAKPTDIVGSLLEGLTGNQETPAFPEEETKSQKKKESPPPEKSIEDIAKDLLGGLLK